MFFTDFTRFSSDVQKANAVVKEDKIAQLKEMLALVDDAEGILMDKNTDLDDVGRMLDHTWKLKRPTGERLYRLIALMICMKKALLLEH